MEQGFALTAIKNFSNRTALDDGTSVRFYSALHLLRCWALSYLTDHPCADIFDFIILRVRMLLVLAVRSRETVAAQLLRDWDDASTLTASLQRLAFASLSHHRLANDTAIGARAPYFSALALQAIVLFATLNCHASFAPSVHSQATI